MKKEGVFFDETWVVTEIPPIKSLWGWDNPDIVPFKVGIVGASSSRRAAVASALAARYDVPHIFSADVEVKNIGYEIGPEYSLEGVLAGLIAGLWGQGEFDEFVSDGAFIESLAVASTLAEVPRQESLVKGLANITNLYLQQCFTTLFYIPYESTRKTKQASFTREIDKIIAHYLGVFDVDVVPLTGTVDSMVQDAVSYFDAFGLDAGSDMFIDGDYED